jgi:hypothetical protein
MAQGQRHVLQQKHHQIDLQSEKVKTGVGYVSVSTTRGDARRLYPQSQANPWKKKQSDGVATGSIINGASRMTLP